MQQFLLILELQFLLFKNSLRSKANRLELASRIIFGSLILFFDLVVAAGLAAIIYFLYDSEQIALILLLVFTAITFYWQIVPLLTASFGGSGLSSARLRLYPISNEKLFVLDLFVGLTDPSAISVYLPLLGIFVGVAVSSIGNAPLAAVGLIGFVLFNAALSRYLQKWLERLLTSRRSKEIIGLAFFLLILIASLVPQLMIRVQSNRDRSVSNKVNTGPANKKSDAPSQIKIIQDNWSILAWTPPGLTARAVAGARNESMANRAGLLLSTLAFPFLLLALGYRRMIDEYYGKGRQGVLPAPATSAPARVDAAASVDVTNAPLWARINLNSPRAAIFEKELRYFSRSPRTILIFISAVFIGLVLVFPMFRHPDTGDKNQLFLMQFILAGVNFYALLVFAQLFNNSFGFDSHGAKLFFLTPVRGRDVLIGKNLAIVAVITLQTTLTLIAFRLLIAPVTLLMIMNTLIATILALFLMLLSGNVISVLYPKAIDFSKMGGMSYSKIAMLLTALTQGTIFSLVALGPFIGWMLGSLWLTYLIFVIELIVVALVYNFLLNYTEKLFERRVDQFFKTLL